MKLYAILMSCLMPLAGAASAQELGPKPVCKAGSRDFNDCARRLGDWQRRRDMLEKQAKFRNQDKDGRKILYIKVKGVSPEAEKKALPNDVIREKNNVRVLFRNADARAWTGNSGGWYRVKYDPATRHYSGWEDLEMRLFSSKEQSAGEKKAKKKAMFKMEKITYDKPLTIRVWAETELGNKFWTEFTAQVQGDAEKGFTIPNEIVLDHYSRTEGKDDEPQLTPPPPRGAQKAEAAKPAEPPPPPAAPAKPREEREITASELMGKFKGLKMKSTNPADHGFAVRATIDLKVKGFAPALAEQLAKDPVNVKKGSFKLKIYLKNTGESAWGNIKSQTVKSGYSGGEFKDFDLEMTVKENVRVSFDKPVTIRVEAKSGDGLYWAETEGSKDSPPAAVVIDRYSPR